MNAIKKGKRPNKGEEMSHTFDFELLVIQILQRMQQPLSSRGRRQDKRGRRRGRRGRDTSCSQQEAELQKRLPEKQKAASGMSRLAFRLTENVTR